MFSRKLTALGYERRVCFNSKNTEHLRDLVLWLEENKIQHCDPETLQTMRDTSLADWSPVHQTYLESIGCPFTVDEITESVDWLLGHAVRQEYALNAEKLAENSAANVALRPKRPSGDVFAQLDHNSAAFAKGVNELATILQIEKHPTDPKVTFRAISRTAALYLDKSRTMPKRKGKELDLSQIDFGADIGQNEGINEAAKIFRLLFLQDLRNLQTNVNEAIVAVQKQTAEPKTTAGPADEFQRYRR